MATISFIKSTNGYTAKIEGKPTTSSIKLAKKYAELKKLDVQDITISPNSIFPTSWEQYVSANS